MVETINICLAADRRYLQHLLVTMASILLTREASDRFHFIILSDGSLSPGHIERLKRVSEFDFELVRASELVGKYMDISEDQHWPLSAYYRLLLPFVFRTASKILYLDCDVIVRHSLSTLWATPLEQQSVAAVIDTGFHHRERLEEQGVHIEGAYFNSGVLLWNLERLPLNDYHRLLQDSFKRLPAPAFADQCWLNMMFDGDKQVMPVEWNVMSHMYTSEDLLLEPYSATEIAAAKAEPKICHFTNIKPWTMTYTAHPYWFEYWQVLKKTPYKWLYPKGYLKRYLFSREDSFLFGKVRPALKKMLSAN